MAGNLVPKSGLYILPNGRVRYVHADDVKRDLLSAATPAKSEGSAALAFARRRAPDGWEPFDNLTDSLFLVHQFENSEHSRKKKRSRVSSPLTFRVPSPGSRSVST